MIALIDLQIQVPKAAIIINFGDGDFAQDYEQIKEHFERISINKILPIYSSDQDFRSINGNNAGTTKNEVG